MQWHALALVLALLPSRWFGRLLEARTPTSTELVGAAGWVTGVTAAFLLASPSSRLVRFGSLGWGEAGIGTGAGVLLFVLGAAGYVASESLLGLARPPEAASFASLRGAGEMTAAMAAVLAVAVAEEVAFRGIVLEALREHSGTGVAVGVSAAAFALYHLSAHQLLSTLVYGGVLAGLVVWTGGLWPAVIAHLTLNGLGVALSALTAGGPGG